MQRSSLPPCAPRAIPPFLHLPSPLLAGVAGVLWSKGRDSHRGGALRGGCKRHLRTVSAGHSACSPKRSELWQGGRRGCGWMCGKVGQVATAVGKQGSLHPSSALCPGIHLYLITLIFYCSTAPS